MNLTQRLKVVAAAGVLCLVGTLLSSTAHATLIGNDVTTARDYASDGGGSYSVLAVISNAPIPSAGILTAFDIFDQVGGDNFNAYVLRPLDTTDGGGNPQYLVVAADQLTSTGSMATLSFPVAPVAVLPGDLIAEEGHGVPFNQGDGPFPLVGIYLPDAGSPINPAAGDTIALGSSDYPGPYLSRNYALAANVTAVPEPSSILLCALGALCIGAMALRRRRN